MNRFKWYIRKLKWMTPSEEIVLFENVVSYAGILFVIIMIISTIKEVLS